ncbi:MAG: ABC-type nitrate/sulfonate/bicarbonate transport system substrate-binding protein [Colwellia sp.]|jgi:ABC-type nitrate/sulfonate/bicarbonate transport system substrate-binding protein
MIYKFLLIALLVIPLDTSADNKEPTLNKVRVQLKCFHQFQFAGFYAAIEQGYFKEVGLDVELIEGGPTIEVTEKVTSGKAEFGIGNSSLLIDYNNGAEIVAVAALFQHSPSIILARRDESLHTVKDLEGRTLMGEIHTAELMTYLKMAGVDLKK